MELAKLRYFYTVAKIGHVTKAAEEIHIAQPALTKAIKQLEEELGVPLFYKKGRNIYPTVYGEYLKNKLEGLFAQVDSIQGEIETLKEERRRTVKINVLAATAAISDAVVAYKKKYPETVFQLIQSAEETDCDVFVTGDLANAALSDCQETKTIEEEIFLAIPKSSAYAQRESIDLKEVQNEGFVHLAGSRCFRTVCDGFLAKAGVKPKISFESDSLVAVRNIIGASIGVGFWPEFSWGQVSADVKLLRVSAPICRRVLTIGLRESATPSSVAPQFYAFLLRFLQRRRKKMSALCLPIATIEKINQKGEN